MPEPESLCPVTSINQGTTGQYPKGTLLSDIIRAQNGKFPFPCNGRGTCGKCRVKAKGQLSEPSLFEQTALSPEDLASFVRLACQTHIFGPVELTFTIQEESQYILHQAVYEFAGPADSIWKGYSLETPPVISWETISRQLPPDIEPTLKALRQVGELNSLVKQVVVETLQNRAVAIHTVKMGRYGVAVDIGTTTLAAYLADLEDGRVIATSSAYNPQSSYGADVISRIGYSSVKDGLAILHRELIKAINGLIRQLTAKSAVSVTEIMIVNVVGNSSMIHFLLNVSPAGLGKAPFEPIFVSPQRHSAAELGIAAHPDGLLTVLPAIGGFVGSDISAGVLTCRMQPDKTELLIDIGTNGEVVLAGKGRMLACSTAAGPAFEGANIACGMLAGPGAIIDLAFDGEEINLTTLDGQPARGLCGTGLVRVIVELLRRGVISETGSFNHETKDPNFDSELKRYYLSRDREQPVYLSQGDIRQFQLAKGAIRAGLDLMLARLSLTPADLQTFYIAGAFGNYLHPEDAVFLGLIPDVPRDRIKTVGNTAGWGALISLLSQEATKELAHRVVGIEHVDLAGDPGFTDAFTEAMLFAPVN